MSEYSRQMRINKEKLGFKCAFQTSNALIDKFENAKKYNNFLVIYDFGDFEIGAKFNSFDEFVAFSLIHNKFKKADVKCK